MAGSDEDSDEEEESEEESDAEEGEEEGEEEEEEGVEEEATEEGAEWKAGIAERAALAFASRRVDWNKVVYGTDTGGPVGAVLPQVSELYNECNIY